MKGPLQLFQDRFWTDGLKVAEGFVRICTHRISLVLLAYAVSVYMIYIYIYIYIHIYIYIRGEAGALSYFRCRMEPEGLENREISVQFGVEVRAGFLDDI